MRKPFVVSIAAGLIAVMCASAYLKRREATLLHIAEPVAVVVAAENVDKGRLIDRSMVRTDLIPRRFVAPSSFVSTDDVIGRVALIKLDKGEQVASSRIVSPGMASGIAPVIPPGMRAVSIEVDDVTGVGGLIKPGDRVDVAATFDFGDDRISKTSTAVLIENALVLAVGKSLVDEPPDPPCARKDGILEGIAHPLGNARPSSAITMAALPTDAQAIILAQRSGSLTLMARAHGDGEMGEPQPMTLEELIGRTGIPRRRREIYREYRGK